MNAILGFLFSAECFFVVNIVINRLEFNVFIKGTDIIKEPQYSMVGQSSKVQCFDVFKYEKVD